MEKESNESMEKLAGAMGKLAETLEKFQDPILWQKVFQDAVSIGVFPQTVVQQLQVGPPQVGPPAEAVRIQRIEISLSDEERENLATKIHEAIQPQLAEFNEFLRDSLKEMPPHRLKQLAAKVEEGAKPALARRRGCVFIIAGDDEFYLGL